MRICHFDGSFGRFFSNGRDRVTVRFQPGHYIYEDLSPRDATQLCADLRPAGATITWSDSADPAVVAKAFAKDIGAKLILDEAEYDTLVAGARARAAAE